jgi:hypothetical protein
MLTTEKIQRYVERLPASLQQEVLHFVEFLLSKTDGELQRDDDRVWLKLSLAAAMRGHEDEAGPEYTPADLQETF